MTMYWLYDLPNWLFGLCCVLFFNAVAVAGLYSTRGWVRRRHLVDHSQNDIVSYFLAAVAVFYGITLGLLTVGAWSNYQQVEARVDTEAQVMSTLYGDLGGYPEPARTILRTDLKLYTRTIIDGAWPLQRKGIIPGNSTRYLDQLQQHITLYEPSTSGQQIMQGEVFRQFNDLVDARRARINSVTSHLPRSLWTIVILGALLTLAVTLFFDTASFSMHVWLTFFLATLLGLMIFMVASLDSPFRGPGGVSPAPLETVYRQLMH